MALQLGALRAALVDAGADEAKADKAAEEVAGYDAQLHDVRADLRLLKWGQTLTLGGGDTQGDDTKCPSYQL